MAVLFPEATQLLFVVAKLFTAVGTGKTGVGGFRKTLRVQMGGHFPADEQEQGQAKQRACKKVADESQGREHHGIIPVVDTATGAAFIFHEPGLKRAEKQDADHVAYRKSQADQQQDPLVQNAGKIQRADDSVEGDPKPGDQPNAFGHGRLLRGSPGGNIIFPELLLATHAFHRGGEKTQCHFYGKDQPNDPQQPRFFFQVAERLAGVTDAVENVEPRGGQKQHTAEDQLHKMQKRNVGKL